jgi:hypothetical protein
VQQTNAAIPAGRTGPTSPPLAYRGRELARALSVCERSLLTLRQERGLPFIVFGSAVLYPRAAVRAWLRNETQRITPKNGEAVK